MVSKSYSKDSNDSEKESDLFKEAEDFIKEKMNNLLGLGYQCGLATKQMAQKELESFGVEDEVVKPTWRMDPRQSFSDLILVVKDGKQSHIYHVHKVHLTMGERKSGLLTKLLGNSRSNVNGGGPEPSTRSRKNVLEVVVEFYPAQFIPFLLDYIYEDKLELNATIAPALRRLANQFDVRTLYTLVSSFIQQDLSEETVSTYLEQAELVHDRELTEVATMIAVQSFDVIPDKELGKIPPQVLQQMVSDKDLNAPTPERLCQRIATYMRSRERDIDDESFFFLTHANILPKISPDEALWYLSYGLAHFPGVMNDEGDGGYEATLKYRCMVAASKNWKTSLLSPIKADVKRKQEGGIMDGTANSHLAYRKKRLFGDGMDLVDSNGRAYLELSDDVKVEILQLALLEANNMGQNMSSNMGVGGVMMHTTPRQGRSEVMDVSTRDRSKSFRDNTEGHHSIHTRWI